MFELRDDQPFRLVPSHRGRHQFGGNSSHAGVVPSGTNVALQLLLSLDLRDPQCPVETELRVSSLPLYYPFKFGCGGPSIQYAVKSDAKIEILYLSDTKPDTADAQYLSVDELPRQSMELVPLTYEEARVLAFLASRGFFSSVLLGQGYFKPTSDDLIVINRLDLKNLIRIGNQCSEIPNMGDIVCQNRDCEFSGRRVHFLPLATVPPIPVNGEDDFWHEFKGGDLLFCFGLCYYCRTIIGFNVAG